MIPAAVLVMGIIIALSALLMIGVTFLGTRPEEHPHGESEAVAYWSARADKLAARQQKALEAGTASTGGAAAASDADADKERKRQEALARKAARAAKSE